MKLKSVHWVTNVLLAMAIAAFVFVVVPAQTYLGSPEMFDYAYGRLFVQGCVGALVVGLVVMLMLFLAECVFGHVSHVVALSVLICLYLETGVLSIGLPPINGVADFRNLLRSGLDACAWGFVIASAVLFRCFILNHFRWFFGGTVLMICASIFDAGGGSTVGLSAPLSDGFYPRSDVVKNVKYSSNRNVLVYILDMTPAAIATDVVEQNPELKAMFPGFTCFRRNLCMHEETIYGLPGLMTGRYWGPSEDRAEYGMSIFGTNSFLYSYVKADAAVYYSGGMHLFGYTNRHLIDCSTDDSVKDSGTDFVFFHPSTSIPYLRMYDAIRIRIVPFYFKQHYLRDALSVASTARLSGPNVGKDRIAWGELDRAGITDEKLTLVLVHTDALHWPISFDRNGEKLAQPLTIPGGVTMITDPTVYRQAMREAGYYILKSLGEHFEVLRAKGVYDNATIVIAADHGCIAMREGDNYGSESSIFWYKPRSAKTFEYSDAPTTNAKLCTLMNAVLMSDVASSEAETILSSRERVFRGDWHGVTLHSFGGRLHYKDWVYDEESNLVRIDQY